MASWPTSGGDSVSRSEGPGFESVVRPRARVKIEHSIISSGIFWQHVRMFITAAPMRVQKDNLVSNDLSVKLCKAL